VPVDLTELVAPAHTALVTCEAQVGVMGELAGFPALHEACVERDLAGILGRLATGARRAGVPVVHATIAFRPDRAGAAFNTPLLAGQVRHGTLVLQGTPGAALVPELGPEPGDVVVPRMHGLTPFTGTELDAVLRNLGVRTIVAAGVSLNEGVLGLCLSAADLGYRLAVPADAVLGLPEAYGDDVLANTIALLASVTSSDAVLTAWADGA
jgi:nicotinamidase-related amidase